MMWTQLFPFAVRVEEGIIEVQRDAPGPRPGPWATQPTPVRGCAGATSEEVLRAWVLEGHTMRAIFFAHDVKTLGAAARFLASPISERPIRRSGGLTG